MVSGLRQSSTIIYSLNGENLGPERSVDVKESTVCVRFRKTWDRVLSWLLVGFVTLAK